MAKKSVLREAILNAEEISNASLDNAKAMVLEAFAPKLTDMVRSQMKEEEDLEDDVFDDGSSEEELMNDDEIEEADCGDEDKEKVDEEDDPDLEDDEDMEFPDEEEATGDEDTTDLPDTDGEEELDVPDELFDDESDDEDMAEEDMPDDEEEMSSDEDLPMDSDDEDIEEEDGDDEELDLDIEDDDMPVDDTGDEELDLDIEDDDEVVSDEDLDVNDDGILDDEDDDMVGEEDDLEDGIYMKKEGKFTKISPVEALHARIAELEEERDKATKAVGFLTNQLQEVNLFNAKLAYSNRLFNSKKYTTKQKIKIAEQLDRAKTVKQVKSVFKYLNEAKVGNKAVDSTKKNAANPLFEYKNRLTATNKKLVVENVYESPEIARINELAGL